jgi:hypothetical protein
MLPALAGLIQPGVVSAQATPTQVVLVSAPGDGWVDEVGGSGGAVCATGTTFSGSCSTSPWGGRFSGAAWIWKASGTNHVAEHVTFTKTFEVPDNAYEITGTISITADNAYQVSLNGVFLGSDGAMDINTIEPSPFSWVTVETYSLEVAPGVNTLSVTVANHVAIDAGYNPAGLIYRLDLSYTVGIADVTPPEIETAGDLEVKATGPDGAFVSYAITASDAVDGNVQVTCEPASETLFAIGSTTVNCMATDAAGNTGTASFAVTILGAAAQLDELIATVAAYNLHQGISNSLDSKLSNARTALEAASAGDLGSACGKLSAFVNEVYAQSGGKLTVAQATDLVARASQIATVIGC